MLGGLDALAPERAGFLFERQLHADIGHILLHQLANAAPGTKDWRVVEDDAERLAVRLEAHTVGVHFAKAHLVQQRIGQVRVVLKGALGLGFIIEGGGGERRRLAGLAQAEVDSLNDFIAIHRMRHGKAEALVIEDLVHNRVRMAEIEGEDGIAGFAILPEQDLVVADLLILLEEREVFHEDMAVLHVDIAGHSAQVEDLGVLYNVSGNPVDIGQLVAGGVHLPVVGVAFQHDGDFGRDLGEAPGEEDRHVGVEARGEPVVEVLMPELKLVFLRLRVQLLFVGVVAMELGQVVLGIPGHRSAVGPGHQVHEDAMRAGEGEADGEIVGRVHDDGLAANGQPDGEAGGEVFIAQHILIPEHEVLGGVRRAVRPSDAFTQVEGVGGAVIGDFPGFGQIGAHIGAVTVVAHQLRVHEAVSEDAGIAGAYADAAPGAAVLTDLIQRFDHHRVGW